MKIKIVTSPQAALRTWRTDTALIVMPFRDSTRAARAAGLMAMRACAPGLLLAVQDDGEGFVSLVNRLFAGSASPFFGYVGEDAFAGRSWLRNAMDVMATRRAGLLAFNDGKHFGTLACFGLARRSWAQNVYGGPFFFPGYHGPCANAELSMIASGQRALAYAPDSVLLQMECERNAGDPDDADRRLLLERQALGFDGKIAVKALTGAARSELYARRRPAGLPARREANGIF